MLLSFRCRNFRSIKEDITFSMLAVPSIEEMQEFLIPTGIQSENEKNVVRFAEIYGANASGKTNTMRAIHCMAEHVRGSNGRQPGDKIQFSPHKLSKSDEPTEFLIWFIKNDVKFFYAFSCDSDNYQEESLYYYPNGTLTKVFERKGLDFSFGTDFPIRTDQISNWLKGNRLLLSVAANITNIECVNDAFMFFRDDIVFISPSEPQDLDKIFDENGTVNEEKRNEVVRLMKALAPGLKDIKVSKVPVQLTPKVLDYIRRSGANVDINKLEAVSIEADYGLFSVEMDEESDGIKSLFNVCPTILSALSPGKLLLWDEIEKALHPVIAKEIVSWFCKKKFNSQIIATTHNPDLLDLNLVRKDQVWFTEMNKENRSTDLYSLAAIKNVYKNENINEGYLEGRYGAIPVLKTSLLREFDGEKK